MKIAFIGLGNMGGGMAANQAKAGRTVTAFDLSTGALDRARAAGCTPATSVVEAVKDADVVITMLPAGPHVMKVYSEQVIGAAPTSALLVDCSTIDVDTARKVAALAQEAGYAFADAPVSGGTAAAEAGTLAFMVGCDEAVLARVEAALEPMSRITIRAGDHGAGQAAKICNNMLAAVTMAATAEVMELGARNGLDAAVLTAIMQKSSGGNFFLERWHPWPHVLPDSPSSKGYAAGFQLALMLKDLGLALDSARANGAAVPLGALAQSLYALRSKEAGAPALDFSCIQTLYTHQNTHQA